MRLTHLVVLSLLASTLVSCTQEEVLDVSRVRNKVEYQLSGKVVDAMRAKRMNRTSPIMMRIYKEEGVLEIWKARTDNRFEMIKDYKICAWSGALGPKRKEGDRQAPEGFYTIAPWQMNPNSSYYLAFNIGYPNRYDQSHGGTGSHLMVHGACSSSGCYSMTDAQMLEIFAFARDAFKGGQEAFQLQALPFRMTAENMARHKYSPHLEFWKMLKVGYDHFELTKRPPEVAVCEKKYVFNQVKPDGTPVSASAQCAPDMTTAPALASAYSSYLGSYDVAFAKAERKYEGYIWDEPTEAERKAVVADKRKGHDVAYAPTGNGLEAGKLVRIGDETASDSLNMLATGNATGPVPTAKPADVAATPQTSVTDAPQTVAAIPADANGKVPAATAVVDGAIVPVPVVSNQVATAEQPVKKKSFWKFWEK